MVQHVELVWRLSEFAVFYAFTSVDAFFCIFVKFKRCKIITADFVVILYSVKEFMSMEGNSLTTTQKMLCDLCAFALFNKKINIPENDNLDELFAEAKQQTIFPTAFATLKKLSVKNIGADKLFFRCITKNIKINYNHSEIANVLSQNGIKYVFIKGVASAAYYNYPELRTMGDIDVLIDRADIQRVHDLLLSLGYSTTESLDKRHGHIGYTRRDNGLTSICEVHFKVNGIPDSLKEVFDSYFKDIFINANEISVANGKCLIPNDFHHCMILLLHTVTHLIHEGIGLRHLCDWAVFVNRFSNDEFKALFEKPLKKVGMWRFAQLLTACCEKYLGVDNKEFANIADDKLVDAIIADVIRGGNFGHKDRDRYRQIKYITDRSTNNVSKKGAFSQGMSSIDFKARTKYQFVKRYKVLLPLGWLAVMLEYLILLLTGKRKLDNANTINNAKQRQAIYNEFKLFEVES